MKVDERNIFINNDKLRNLNDLLKEKILYDNICYKHNLTYEKYCSFCNKDICSKCEKEYHLNHNTVNYESLLPDINEINSTIMNIKQYENDNNIFMNEINLWKKEFNDILNEYIIKVNNNLELFKNINFVKMNFNLIYKYRLILGIFSEYEYSSINNDINEKNKRLIQTMEKYLKEKEKINIKKDCDWLFDTVINLKKFVKHLKFKNSFSNTFNKIIDIIDLKKGKNFKEISPYLFDKMRTNSSYDNNNKTSASSGNNLYNKKIYNNTVESIRDINDNNKQYKTSKSVDNINNKDKINNLKFFGIYERKTMRQKSMENDYNLKNLNLNLVNDLDNNNMLSNYNNNYEYDKTKMNKNILQNSINDTKIFLFKNPKDRNKIKFNKTTNFINKTVFNNYNNFQNNIKITKPEAFINTSYTNKDDKNISKIFKYNNSLDKINTKKEINNIFLINENNNKEKIINSFNYNKNNYRKNKTRTVINNYRQKVNNSVENSINRKNINCFINKTSDINDIDIGYNQTYNNKNEISLYVHKRFITLDFCKTLSSFESNTSSIISSSSSKKNKSSFINNEFLMNSKNNNNDNLGKAKLYIGLELGSTECKIALYNKDDNQINNLNYLTVPTTISFMPYSNNPNKINIKIEKEPEAFQIEKYPQTIFNIMKFFMKNNSDILEEKNLWYFNKYNNSTTSKPMIKIKYLNKDIYYNIEDILSIYLKKVFEMFFAKLKIDRNYLKIYITIGVPNYFYYFQRNLLKKIFTTKLFEKNIDNKYYKYHIELKNIYIENISNLLSYSLFDNYFQQKFNIYNLIIFIEECSTNISLIKLSKENKNNFIEIKYINSAEFGEEDFLNDLINSCLEQIKQKTKNNYCLNSPLILSKIRKELKETKKKFDKEETTQEEICINRLLGSLDLKLGINIDNYYSSCMGLFRKIILLIKETLVNSGIDVDKINDIILIGNMTKNTKLKKMISELFKQRNEYIYNKLINKSKDNDDHNNYIIKGALLNCYNKSINFPKYKMINISPSSIGIENYLEQMEFIIKKGDYIPIRINKYIKIKKPINNIIRINIFEGENKYVKMNKLISNNNVDINNLINIKKEGKYVELLFQIVMDSNYNLSIYILDKITYKRQFECLI